MTGPILVATDFSACAERAVRLATAWAARWGAPLEIVHVFEPPTRAVPEGGAWLADDVEAAHSRELSVRLEQQVAAARGRGATVSGVLLTGRPHDAVAERARVAGADLAVLGARGLGRIEGLLLGSVTERVLRTAPCAVLVVPEHGRVDALPRVIVAPTDLSEAAVTSVERARSLAVGFDARLEVVHAWELPPIPRGEQAIVEDVEGAALAEVRRAHPRDGAKIGHHARQGAPADVILALVAEKQADLVVMPRSGRRKLAARLLGGVTDRVVRSANVPVMVVPPPGA